MLGGDLSELGKCCGGERVVGDAVDLARQALGGVEQRLDSGGLEQWQLTAGELQAVCEIGGQLLTGEPAQVVAHHDALGEGFVHRHGQAPAQFG